MQFARWGWFLVLLFVTQVAQAREAEEIIKAIEAKYADVGAMKASFVQTTRSELFGEEKQSGDVVLKRPSKMKWNFTGDKQFVTDGHTMWVYTKADNQVIKYDDVSSGASSADSLLQSMDRLSEIFNIHVISDEAGGPVLALSPKDPNAKNQFKALQLTLTDALVVKGVSITDSFGGVTELAFSNVDLGATVPDSVFVFVVPEGAEVIGSGGM